MATLRQIRRKIRSVQSIQRVTKAMRMMSAARLRKAQDALVSARPYADQLQRIIGNLIHGLTEYEHPLLERREPNRHLVIVIAADRGLCGAFNTNVCRAAMARVNELGRETPIIAVGTRAAQFFTRRNYNVIEQYTGIFNQLSYTHAVTIAELISSAYTDATYDHIEIVYNEFVSMLQQAPTTRTLLPIPTPSAEESSGEQDNVIYEPGQAVVLDGMIPKQVETQVWRSMLESQAAEQAARMNAMENATKNASEMIDDLVLERNRVRQTMITKEIAEIVGGAEALKQ
ncbi:MAG: ATP synthase F1 subunit gamma [Candidatus Poribacteria bacterium]|nr:ATP synthase F1 subunit gamma [Candidatus Poribacteria bacterium]